MNREEAKKAAEVMLAYANGEDVEIKRTVMGMSGTVKDIWVKFSGEAAFNFDNLEYRVKPKSKAKYRPFKSFEECWQEMQKHQPFGWVKQKNYNGYVQVQYVMETDDVEDPVMVHFAPDEEFNGEMSLEYYAFVDGAPFGVKEEEV